MNQNYEAIVAMIKELKKAVESKILQAPYDATYEGTILKVLPSNTYLVLVNGKEYTITTKNNTYFKEYQRVLVHVPQNDWNKMRILEDVGTGDTVGENLILNSNDPVNFATLSPIVTNSGDAFENTSNVGRNLIPNSNQPFEIVNEITWKDLEGYTWEDLINIS